MGIEKEELENTNEGLEQYQENTNGASESTDSFADSIKGLQDAFSGFNDNIDLLQTAIDQMNEYGDITADTMEKILNTGNVDMIALLGDRNTFTSGATDLLNQYMQEKENTKNQIIQAAIDEKEGIRSVTNEIDNANNSLTEFKDNASNIPKIEVETPKIGMQTDTSNIDGMVQAYKDAFGEIGGLSDDLTTEMVNAIAEYVNQGGQLYAEDAMNLQAQNQAKLQASEMWKNAEIQGLAQMILANASNYDADMVNWATCVANKDVNGKNFSDDVISQVANMISLNSQNYSTDTVNWANALNNKSNNNVQMVNSIINGIAQMILANASNYSADTVAWANAINNKDANHATMCTSITQQIAQAINNMNTQYGIDAQNFVNATNAKIDAYNSFAVAIRSAMTKEALGGGSLSNNLRDISGEAKKATASLNDLQTIAQRVGNGYAGAGVSGTAIGGNSVSGTSVGGNAVKGSGSGGGSKGSGSGSKGSGSSATAEELKDLSDRYVNLNKKIKDLDNALALNQQQLDETSDDYYAQKKLIEDRIKLIEKEIQANRQLSIARQQEAAELKRQIQSKGGNIDSSGTITNYNSLVNQGNNDQRQATKEIMDRYYELTTELIPQAEQTWRGYYKTIYDLQNKQAEQYAKILEEQRDKYIDNLEKQKDALKKNIEDKKKIMQREWDMEDKEDEVADMQENIASLEQELNIARRTGNDVLIKDLEEQLANAKKELNNTIRDTERDYITDRMDDELDSIEDSYTAQIDAINEKLSDEEILAMVKGGVKDLNGVLDEIKSSTSNINNSFMTVGNTINNTWISGMNDYLEKLNEVKSTLDTINATSNMSTIAGAGGNVNNTITYSPTVTINANGLTKEDAQGIVDNSLEKEFKKFKDENNW